MSLKPWKILDSQYVHPRFRVDTVELPNGGTLKPFVFEFRSWANIVALTENNEVVLVRQYRHGVRESLLELPGGVVEDEEHPLEGAGRELMEETGYSAGKIVEVGRIYPNPAIQHNTLYCYLATGAALTGEQKLDEAEDIEVHLVPLDELIEMTRAGNFVHALHVAVLFKALMHLGRI